MRIASLFVAACLALGAGCGSSSSKTHQDAGMQPPSDAAIDASCFTNPTTNDEIINACTNAQKIYKPGKPPLENADGSLPPLP